MAEWIDVKDRLPENRINILCYVVEKGFKAYQSVMWYDEDFIDNRGYVRTKIVTHWMPLPEPPKGEVENG